MLCHAGDMSDAAEVLMAVFCIYEHLTRIPRREGTTAAEGHLWPSCLVQVAHTHQLLAPTALLAQA